MEKPIIYHVTIEATEKENTFLVHWTGKKNKTHSFEQSSFDIMPEEVEWGWKDRRNQLKIGEKLFRFLDGVEHYFRQALKQAHLKGEMLQVHLSTCRETGNWPFELLAQAGSFLLPQRMHLVRCIPGPEECKELPPQNRPLKLLFMACSPLDIQSELDFEKEEEAIFKITRDLTIDMEVEDTGSLEGLQEKLEKQQYDIIHLSGHAGIDKKGQPFFLMEDETGYRRDVSADELWHDTLSINPPKLLFISGGRAGEAPEGMENSIAHRLVEKYGIQTVLSWGRPVSDMQAIVAAKEIYRDLSRGESVVDAVQRTRYQLINRFPEELTPAWPLLRLFSRGVSFDAIVKKEQKWQPRTRQMTHIYLQNSRVKVLREGFVGRRRQLQQSIRVLKQNREKIGLLLLGTGGLGKSCLAGKISERFKEHTLIIVHGKLNSITLHQALTDAFIIARDKIGRDILAQPREIKKKITDLCSSCFKEQRYLILLDDFEQNLEGAKKGEPGQLLPEAAELLEVFLDCLPDSGKITQLIITCRYGFSLALKDHNIVKERLDPVSLTGFRQVEQWKKATELTHISRLKEPALVGLLLTTDCGNPRLMEWLDVLVGEMEAVEVSELLKAVGDKKEEFIRQHVMRELLQRGGEQMALFLSWFAIYRMPVLKEGAKAIGEKTGLKNWEDLLYQGMDLSLVEYDRAQGRFQGTPLLREQFLKELDNLQPCHEAAFMYYKTECGDKPEKPFDSVVMEEWIYHALGCGEEETASEEGCFLIKYYQDRLAFLEARQLGLWILDQKKQKVSSLHDASLLNVLAITISNLGDHRRAIEYYREALTIRKAIHGDTHKDVAVVSNNLAASWQALGHHDKAIEYYREALRINEAVLGRKHSRVAILLNNLGTACQESGKHREAIGYFEEALAIDEALFGRLHPNVAGELNNLGKTWHELGDYRKGIEYCQAALTIDKEVSGWEHPRTARELDALGSGWRALGEPEKALYYFREALTIDEKLFGHIHPIVAQDRNNLGGAWDDLGNHNEAIECYRKALIIDEKIFGTGHPTIATRKNNLGHSLRLLGEPKKALDYFEQALTIDEKVFGKEHPNTARDLNNLGAAWQELGEHHKALDYYQRALTIDEAAFGRQHANVAKNLNNQGTVWKDLGELNKALIYYEEALQIDKAVLGPQHPGTAIPLNNIGMVWKALREPKKAIAYFGQAMAIDKTAYGPNHPNMGRHLNNLGSAWKDLGEPRKAIACYEQALTIWKNVYGEKHPNVATGLSNLGLAWSESGDHRKALDYLKQALPIDVEVFGWEHPHAANGLNNLGLVYFYLGERERAIDHFQKAHAIYNKSFGPEHPNTKSVAGSLEYLLKGEGKQ